MPRKMSEDAKERRTNKSLHKKDKTLSIHDYGSSHIQTEVFNEKNNYYLTGKLL